MRTSSLMLVLASVLLTSGAQVLLKLGASAPGVRSAIASGSLSSAAIAITTAPLIILGLVIFGVASIMWIVALSRIELSFAYPFISLGILVTVGTSYFLLGESLSASRVCGIGLVMMGVLLIALT